MRCLSRANEAAIAGVMLRLMRIGNSVAGFLASAGRPLGAGETLGGGGEALAGAGTGRAGAASAVLIDAAGAWRAVRGIDRPTPAARRVRSRDGSSPARLP